MLKLPQEDICIESPKQNEYVNTVSNEKQSDNILGHGSYGRVYKAIYRGFVAGFYPIIIRNILVNLTFYYVLDQPVAVKIVRKINMVAAESVTRESNILGWSHENIIKTLKVRSKEWAYLFIASYTKTEKFIDNNSRRLFYHNNGTTSWNMFATIAKSNETSIVASVKVIEMINSINRFYASDKLTNTQQNINRHN